MKYIFSLILLFFVLINSKAQSISSDKIEIELTTEPKISIDANARFYAVKVTYPKSVTAENILQNAKADYEKQVKEYDNTVAESERNFAKKIKDYDGDVQRAKDKYALENEAFKKLTLLERLAMTDQGKAPKLVIPTKPEYYKPSPPIYKEPNLKDFFIINSDVLASQINLSGFERGSPPIVDINIDLAAVKFQDNAGQTFANEPTKLIVKIKGIEKTNVTLFDKFEFISSSPSNNINQAAEERNYLTKVMTYINKYINEQYGYQTIKDIVQIEYVKNKGDYDDLEKAHIYVTTNLKKLSASTDSEIKGVAITNMQKGIDIWLQALTKVDYTNTKAVYNYKIAKYIYFNLIKLSLVLNKKQEAEKYLNSLQENLVDIKLTTDEKTTMAMLEKKIYKK